MRREAGVVGQVAVKQAIKGTADKMITLVRKTRRIYGCTTGLVELEKVANATKMMPRSLINEGGNGMTEEFRKYAMPLIGDPLPEYVKLRKVHIPKKLTT
jgi:6-phosphofructokinase 1